MGPAGWTDDELIAYTGVVSSTLAGDASLVERRSRSFAVRTFAKSLATEHRALSRMADSLSRGRTAVAPPAVSSEVLQGHEREMRRLGHARGFDLAYVKQVRLTLTEAQNQLRRASTSDRGNSGVRLLNRTNSAIASELRAAAQLERALAASQTPSASNTKATRR
jgi:predicted outer membrane protein